MIVYLTDILSKNNYNKPERPKKTWAKSLVIIIAKKDIMQISALSLLRQKPGISSGNLFVGNKCCWKSLRSNNPRPDLLYLLSGICPKR